MATSVAESLPMPVVLCKIRTLPEWLETVVARDHTTTDPVPSQTCAAIFDQFVLNKMARALLPAVCVVRCWERQDHLKGRLMVLVDNWTTNKKYNIGDVIRRDPLTGKAIDWSSV